MRNKIVAGAAAALATVVLWAGPAGANHTHVRELPTGDCVVLAANGEEKHVDLSGTGVFDHNPNAAGWGANNHPIHVLVHKGQPGTHQNLQVMGSAGDPCAGAGNYVNQ